MNYGFRRNLLGLKPLGIAVAGVTILAALVIAVLSDGSTSGRLSAAGPSVAWSLLALVVYWRLIDGSWVRIAAEAYADRLLGCAEVIAHESRV